MNKGTLCAGFLVGSFLATACSTPGPDEAARDFELYYEDGELDTVELEEQDPISPPGMKMDVKVERERVGARFAFGGESARGFFQIFGEDIKAGSSQALTAYGLGGGVKGAPVVTELGQDAALIIPYRGDISLAYGSDSIGITDRALAYAEFHADVGLGLDWLGLRPSVGVALSTLGGAYVADAAGLEDKFTMVGTNVGFFVDLLYKHADFPLYGHVRVQGGDYAMTTFGIGAKF